MQHSLLVNVRDPQAMWRYLKLYMTLHIHAFNKEIAVFLGIEYLEMHISIQSYQYSTLRLVSNIGRDKGTEG